MLDYFIKALLFQTLFLAVYDLILKKETFFQWNRFYLIFTSAISYIIPFIKIDKVAEAMPQEYIIQLPEVLLTPTAVIQEKFDWSMLLFTGLQWLFWIGLVTASLLFILKLVYVFRMIYQNERQFNGHYYLVLLEQATAFSFFNYIFLGKSTEASIKAQIIKHELVHVQQKHSLDLLFFEFQRILFWYNPYSYLFQQRISELHEYIADAKAIKTTEKSHYFQNLMNQSFGTQKLSFINLFFKHSLIKKRIVMLGKNKSKQFLKLKYLLLAPLLIGMLIYTSCENGVQQEEMNKNEKRFATLYMGDGVNTKKRESTSNKEGYFDMYMLGAKATGKEIFYTDLSDKEKLEYDEKKNGFNKVFGQGSHTLKIYESESGKRSLEEIIHWDIIKKKKDSKDYSDADQTPFAAIDKAPIFPGCENASDPRQCFIDNVRDHVLKNFDMSLAKTLNLESDRKKVKVYVQFTIDKEGNILEVRTRGPHKDLEREAERVVMNLPIMEAGQQKNGKKVRVKYTLPITLVVE